MSQKGIDNFRNGEVKTREDKNKLAEDKWRQMRKRMQRLEKVDEAMQSMRRYTGDKVHPNIIKLHNHDKVRLEKQLRRQLIEIRKRYDRIKLDTEKKHNEKAETIRNQIIEKLNKLKAKLINQKKSNQQYELKEVTETSEKPGIRILIRRCTKVPDKDIEAELSKIFDFESYNVSDSIMHKRATRSTAKYNQKRAGRDLHRYKFGLDVNTIKSDIRDIVKTDREGLLRHQDKKITHIAGTRFGFLNTVVKNPNNKFAPSSHTTRSTTNSSNSYNHYNRSNSSHSSSNNNNNINSNHSNNWNNNRNDSTLDTIVTTTDKGRNNDNNNSNIRSNSSHSAGTNEVTFGRDGKGLSGVTGITHINFGDKNENEANLIQLRHNLHLDFSIKPGTAEYHAQKAIAEFTEATNPYDETLANAALVSLGNDAMLHASERELRHLARMTRKKEREINNSNGSNINDVDIDMIGSKNNNNNSNNNIAKNENVSIVAGMDDTGSMHNLNKNNNSNNNTNNNNNNNNNNSNTNNNRNEGSLSPNRSVSGSSGNNNGNGITKRKKSKSLIEKYKVTFVNSNEAIERFGTNKNETPKSPNRDPNYNRENACEIDGIVYRAGERVSVATNGSKQNALLVSLKKTIVEFIFLFCFLFLDCASLPHVSGLMKALCFCAVLCFFFRLLLCFWKHVLDWFVCFYYSYKLGMMMRIS